METEPNRPRTVLYLAGLAALALTLVLAMLYPFLPGDYEALALAISIQSQMVGLIGLLLVPIGVLWLVNELRGKGSGFYFAVVSLVVTTFVAVIIALVGFAVMGHALGLLTLIAWGCVVLKLVPKVKRLKNPPHRSVNVAPLYMIALPSFALLTQLLLATSVTDWSRNRAIRNCTDYINDIENYKSTYGEYPKALMGAWQDYYPSVVGVEKYHYVPSGEAYNLYFEQPRFLLDNIGSREFVVYNPRDEQTMLSHTSWVLKVPPSELYKRQGWYAVHNATTPHWKYFWFD